MLKFLIYASKKSYDPVWILLTVLQSRSIVAHQWANLPVPKGERLSVPSLAFENDILFCFHVEVCLLKIAHSSKYSK